MTNLLHYILEYILELLAYWNNCIGDNTRRPNLPNPKLHKDKNAMWQGLKSKLHQENTCDR